MGTGFICSTDSVCLWYRSVIICYGLQTYADIELIQNNALLVYSMWDVNLKWVADRG